MELCPVVLDRAVGTVVGSAAGDARSAPHEFGPPRPEARCAMEGGGSFQSAPSCTTAFLVEALDHVEPR